MSDYDPRDDAVTDAVEDAQTDEGNGENETSPPTVNPPRTPYEVDGTLYVPYENTVTTDSMEYHVSTYVEYDWLLDRLDNDGGDDSMGTDEFRWDK